MKVYGICTVINGGGYKGILLVLVIIASDSANIGVYTLLNRKYNCYYIMSKSHSPTICKVN